jgi:transketolase
MAIDLVFLQEKAAQIRRDLLTTIYLAQAGHPGGSLSAADLVVALYYQIMRIDPSRPRWIDRDRFILSKGHASALIYAVLADKGYFDKTHLATFRQISGILQGHPDMNKTPGIDMTTGSLGQGLSLGCGMALGLRQQGLPGRVYVLLGDGELDEGQNWEALMFGSHQQLVNLAPIIDRNRLQLDGTTEDIVGLEPLSDKLRAFGWQVLECDGHDLASIIAALEAINQADRPTVLIAHTVKGKGVSYMENSLAWHGQAPNRSQYDQAMCELGGDIS